MLVLLGGLLTAVAILTIGATTKDNSAAKACRAEAKTFAHAVTSYYDHHEPHVWPPAGKPPSVQVVALSLEIRGELAKGALDHLDGTQQFALGSANGWTYDFDNHTTGTARCG